MKRKAPREKDIIPEITVTCVEEGALFKLAVLLRDRTLINHLNRALVHFELPDGSKFSITVWPKDDDDRAYAQRCEALNWSEH